MMAVSEIQIGVRMPVELREKLREAAKKSGWSVSAQIRYQLCHDFGIEHKPYLPQPELSFNAPAQGAPGKKSRRRRKAA